MIRQAQLELYDLLIQLFKEFNKNHPNTNISITNEDIQDIYKRAKKIQIMSEGREKNIASNELLTDINKLVPSTIVDKVYHLLEGWITYFFKNFGKKYCRKHCNAWIRSCKRHSSNNSGLAS